MTSFTRHFLIISGIALSMPPQGSADEPAVKSGNTTLSAEKEALLQAGTRPTPELSLDEVFRRVESSQPDWLADRLEEQVAAAQVRQAGLRPNPVFAVEAENFGGKGEWRGFDGAEYTAQLEQTVETGGKRTKRRQGAMADQILVMFDLAGKQAELRAEARRRFVAMLGAQERLVLDEDSLALAEELVKVVGLRVQAGKASPMEEEKARVLLAQQQVARDHARREVKVAQVQLSSLWGSVQPDFSRASGDLAGFTALPEDAALEAGLRMNPEVARWGAEIQQKEATVRQEDAARLPDVTVSGGIREAAEGQNRAFVVGLSVPLPLMDRNQGKREEAAVKLAQAQLRKRAVEVAARAELIKACDLFKAAVARIESLRQEVIPRSKSLFEGVQKAYVEGKYTYLDVLDARRTFLDARTQYIEALVDGQMARIEVDLLVGNEIRKTR